MTFMKITYEAKGTTYLGEVMTIESATIRRYGKSLAIDLMFTTGSTGQGTGGYGVTGERLVEWIEGVTDVVGVEEWERVPGHEVLVLRKSWGGFIEGIVALQKEDRVFWFATSKSGEELA